MDKFIYHDLHSAADRLALEAVRRGVIGNEASKYSEVYEKTLSFLMERYKEYNKEE